jgi:putative membrane protein
MMYPGIGPGGIGPAGVIVMFLFMLFFVIIIGFIIFAITRMGMHGHMWHSTMNRDALDIAKERYARGEITAEEFVKIKKNLS